MKSTFSWLSKAIIFSIFMVNLTHFTIKADRPFAHFVNPQPGDRIIDLLVKTGDTLNDIRYSVAEVIIASASLVGPGFFILGDNIEGDIIIFGEDIWLDLNNFQVYSNVDSSTLIRIIEDSSNISIFNGSIKGSGSSSSMSSGIFVEQGTSSIKIADVEISELENGIYFDGSSTSTIRSFNVKNCNIVDCKNGVVINNAIKGTCKKVQTKNCLEKGFELNNSYYNIFKQCNALEIENNDPDTPIFGFGSLAGKGNLFLSCLVAGLKKTMSNLGINATGLLLSDETESKIIDCSASQIEVSGSGDAYGINITGTSTNNSIRKNLVTNITGGADGIGIDGDDTKNLIMQNISYENDTAYGPGITPANIHQGATGTPGNLQNIEI